MTRRTNDFQTIRSEGGLLPPDLLRRVLDPKEKLDGTRPEDYGLPQGERLHEVITQSWSRLRKHWAEFRLVVDKLPQVEPGTGLTNDKWSLPLLRELGFGLLPTSAGPEVNGRGYAINRFFGPVPIHLVGCGLSLDRRAAGVRGAAALNPHGLVQDFLNRSSGHLWAIVSNGLRLRVLRDSQTLSRQSFLEFDLEAMLDGEVYSDFVLLWLIAHATRFAPREGERPESCWLEHWTKIAVEQGVTVLKELGEEVEEALKILGEGFTSHPKNVGVRDALRTGQVTPTEFHGQLLRVVYRLIFLFVAEDRTLDSLPLLHPRDGSESARLARGRYAAHYSTGRLRDLAGKIKGSRHGDLWQQFLLVVRALSGDPSVAKICEHLALPALGSFLWDPSSTAALNAAQLTNHDFLEALRHLAFTHQGKVLRPVDYRNLGAEELGGVYESLLALTPEISADGARFTFAEFAGNERKTSGSYYTPDSLVQCLLDSALDPVVEETIKGKTSVEAEKAILALKVCDPAVGSGHFLVGAAHRLARHLARVRALTQGESEPSPLLYQHALRDVIGRCLYGVDLNPMAAELCRVSLWLEALEPGKPLSFLDHHIRVGNSLLGATPELIAAGLPDEAFTAIEGDDQKVCAGLKKQNRQEREGQRDMAHLMVAEPKAERNSIEERVRGIDETPDHTICEIQRKAEQFRRLVVSPEYQHAQQVADTWSAAFVWKKQASPVFEAITTDTIRCLEADPKALTLAQRAEVERLSARYQFFHWHLAFPEVFAKGGFDCVLGNPPWERVKMQEREWFAASHPQISEAQTGAIRARLIERLAQSEPAAYAAFKDATRQAQAETSFVTYSGRFPLGAVGDTNTYPLFIEGGMSLISASGRVGLIVKTGILADYSFRKFFSHLVETGRFVSGFDFSNRKLIFPAVVANERFTLLTLAGAGSERLRVSILNEEVTDLRKPGRIWELDRDKIALINPNTKTCPLFQNADDAKLVSHIYELVPVLMKEADKKKGNPWGVLYFTMFHMTNDSGLFRDMEALQQISTDAPSPRWTTTEGRFLSVLEGKLFDLFDHRHGNFQDIPRADRFGIKAEPNHPTIHEKSNPACQCLPRYWVGERQIQEFYTERLGFEPGGVLAFRDVCRTHTDYRTVRAAICPALGAGNKAPLLLFPGTEKNAHAVNSLLLCSNLDAFALDYVARQKFAGGSLNKYILIQLPCIPPFIHAQPCKWRSLTETLKDWLIPRILELTYTAWDLEAFARDCGWSGPPFRWNEERRILLRCELDAAFFHLYLPAETNGDWCAASAETAEGLARLKASFPTPRDAVAYIMNTFPIVRRKDEEKYNGDYHTKRVILEIYDAMAEAIRTGKPYQTRLDPPPADPRCCHPKLKMGILAYGSLITDPGDEISPKIMMRIQTQTPFPVEYGRFSQTRGGAPTLVPHPNGAPVCGEIFILDESVSSDYARDMLWRRERQKAGSGEQYAEGTSSHSVLVRTITAHPCVATVHYTDFRSEGKLTQPSALDLAQQAIQSVKKADSGKDGITYLINAMSAGIITPLTESYIAEILRLTNTASLSEALKAAQA